uniref:Intersectin 2a n=2 Tax=Nothobranchius korthausae TaxID=1143690 RepID=A0A1A8FG31_9TELE
MNGGASVWAITPEERGKHDKQFENLAPVLGYVSGEQARKFFLQSGLPASVLAEIWSLADMDYDGKMDRLEFSVAMKLIKLKLQGRSLPSALPSIMKQTPSSNNNNMTSSARFGMGSMPNLSVGLSSMSAVSTMSILTPLPANPPFPSLQPLVPMTLPLITSFGNSGLPNGTANLLTSPLVPISAGLPVSGFSSPMAFSPSTGMSKASSLLDLGSSSSNSSSTASLASNSPKMGAGDWAVPQASRLKYRQQFNTLDKLMTGYLSGPQVRNALMASNLTQTQLATIWSLADVDKDGQLRADEFILAMHLVETAKTGRPLPLSLPQDLIPPSLRGGLKSTELVNGTGPYLVPGLIDTPEVEPALKSKSSVSYEDKLKENFARGSAELEKRRLALEEEQRKERERREREEREERERREREVREMENRRRLEEERRLERQQEVERQREEDRLRELERKEAAKQEVERQRREEWERQKREELGRRKEEEQEEISRLRAKKKSLELELEAVGNKHKQISDRLRDAQSKRRIQKAEVDLINQRRDARVAEISTLQLQFEDWQRKLSQLVPQQQLLTDKLRSISLNRLPSATLTSVTGGVTEKSVNCRRLKDQLDVLEKETTDKLAQMEQYNKELKLGDMEDCVLRGLLSLLACLSQLFLLIKELREKQVKQQAVLDDLHRVKEEKLREVQRRREEDRERRRKSEEEEAARRAKLEQERREREQKEQEKREREEEEARQRRLQEEQKAKQKEEEERQAMARLRAAQEKAQEEEERRRRREEEEKKKKMEEQEAAQLTTYRALYSFVARNADELSIDAHGLIEVDEHAVGEPGWLFGGYHGNRGWFPQSYAEKCPTPSPLASSASSPGLPVTLNARDSGVEEEGDSTASALSDAPQPSGSLLARAVSSWSATSETLLSPSSDAGSALLSFSQGDVISVLQQRDDWWFGQLNGTQGWFPQTCVTLEAAGNPDLDSLDSCDPAQLEEYVALYTYESPETGDLTFAEGDVVMVTEREGEWWRGCIGDQTGVFPSNYVRPVEPEGSRPGASNKRPAEIAQAIASTLAPAAHQLCLSPGQLVVVRAKNSTGWWLGELQVRGKKRQKAWLHSSHVKLLGPSSSKSSPCPLPVCQVIAMYDYAAANQDELSFCKGQLINVLDKTNPDWWKGEANGVTGLLPTNYVKMTTECDPSQQ